MRMHVRDRLPVLATATRGFTLLEMIIALGIVVILSGITVESITKSRSHTALNQTAQELTLLLREVQQQGISVSAVKRLSCVSNCDFYPAVGARFDLAANNQVILFPDLPASNATDSLSAGNLKYDQTGFGNTYNEQSTDYYQEWKLNPRVVISAIRYDDGTPNGADINPGSNRVLHVIYHRPDPTVYFTYDNGGPIPDAPGATNHVWICLTTTDGSNLVRKIDIWKTGQISLMNTAGAYQACN